MLQRSRRRERTVHSKQFSCMGKNNVFLPVLFSESLKAVAALVVQLEATKWYAQAGLEGDDGATTLWPLYGR